MFDLSSTETARLAASNDLVSHGTISAFADSPLHLARAETLYHRLGKRVIDITLVLVSLPVILPVILLLAGLVMQDRQAPFFGHVRVGRDGRLFRCWKLRSMVPDAEARLRRLLESDPIARAEWEANFKLAHDPRVTRLGNILRRFSLDELPQLWNVLKGEMSLVGPRPVTLAELSRYGQNVDSYMAMLPGMTGLWQISGRNTVAYGERVSLDIRYAQKCSPVLDMMIVLRTAVVVVGRTGQ